MSTVFVTGSDGFLGKHLCKYLIAAGHTVVGLQRDWSLAAAVPGEWPQVHHMVHGDVYDKSVVERAMAEYAVDAVIHLAAQAQVSSASAEPSGAFRTNVFGTFTVLESARLQKIKRVIVASTDKVYGESSQKYSEDTPLLERNPYGASKVCADVLAQTYQKHYGMSVAITRCGNLYGPGHYNWSTLIPGTLKRFVRGEKPVLRFGGKAVRDFLYVEDAVRAYARLLELDHVVGPFNFSGGEPTTIISIVTTLARLWGAPEEFEVKEDGVGEIVSQALDCSRASRDLEWSAFVPLHIGLEKTVAWYKNHFNVENPSYARAAGGNKA
jgi:CDP-glucose 4,6-dehydratase